MRKEEKTELTKRKILAAAIQEFGSNGYRGASLNAICKSGISKGLLYHNYKNKDALYLSCVAECFDTLSNYLKRADIGDDLEAYMRIRMEFFAEHKMEACIFFEAVLQPPEALYDEICLLKKDFDAFNQKLYSDILNSIKLREGITQEDAMMYFSMVQDMFNRSFHRPDSQMLSLSEKMKVHEQTLPKLLDLMLYGIARRDCK